MISRSSAPIIQIEHDEHHGQVLLAVAEVVLQMVAVVFQRFLKQKLLGLVLGVFRLIRKLP